jgi:hypothetical protein
MAHTNQQSPTSDAADVVRYADLRFLKLQLGIGLILSVVIGILALWLLWRISDAITAQLLG